MNRKLKMVSLLLVLLLVMPVLAFASEEAPSEPAMQPQTETTTSEESTTPATDENAGSSSGEESSADSESTGGSEEDSSEENSSDNSSSDGSTDESEGSTSDDELTGEEEGNTSDEELTGEDEENISDGNTGEGEGGEEDSESGDGSENADGDSSDEKDEKKEESKSTSSSKKSSSVSYSKERTEAVYEGTRVTVEELGTIHTQIKLGDGELAYVLTGELAFPDLNDQPLQLAYFVAPKTGRASLRDQPAKNETIIRYGSAGDLAIVLEEGEDYTYILYRGTKCYALNSTLQLFDIPEEDGEYAELSYEERTDGGTTINIRNQPDRSSCKIAEWRTGTEVTAWNYVDGWYEIEANGMRGFVMEQYITIAPGV